MRPESYHRPGELGIGDDDLREDKHLSEITALIDPRQFELISKPTSGLVVIQGGAGSGKTTIGLHRLAYLAFQDPQRFPVIVRFDGDDSRGFRRVGGQANVVVYAGTNPVLNAVAWLRIRLTTVLSYVR